MLAFNFVRCSPDSLAEDYYVIASLDQIAIAGIPVDNSEINMAVRSVPVAMDEATAVSTAASSVVPPHEKVEVDGTSD